MSENAVLYSIDFQRSVLKLLCTNLKFAVNYGILLREDYFESQPLRVLLNLSLNHVMTYAKEVEYEDFSVLIEDYIQSKGYTKESYNLLKDESRLIFKAYIKSEQFVIDQMIKFIRRQELKMALAKSIDVLKSDGSYESVLKMIDGAVSIGCGAEEGYSFEDIIGIQDEYKKFYDSDKLIRTGIHTYDKCLDGGMAPGELHVVMSPPKAGKTTLGVNFGVYPLALGKTVFHVTLEIAALPLLRKYAARITGMSYRDMLNVDKEVYEEKINRFKKYQPNLFVNYWPMGSTNTMNIRSWISRIRSKKNVTPGLIIIDWDDCLIPSGGSSDNMYMDSGSIYTDFKLLAEYFNCPVVTFAQPTREAWDKPNRGEVINCYEISQSAKKVHYCDSISSMNFPYGKSEGFFYVDLVRRGESSVKFPIKRDFDRALIQEVDQNSGGINQ